MAKLVMQAVADDPRAARLDELDDQLFERLEAQLHGGDLPDTGSAWSPAKLTPVDLDATVPGPLWLVPNILERESLTVLAGPPAQGKSWVAMSLALALARGTAFLGQPVDYRHRVMYLDHENGDREIRRRFQALGWSTDSPGKRLRVFTDRPKITDDAELRHILGEIDAFGPDLVVIDTFASAAILDENSVREVEDFFARVWRPLRRRGIALLVLHHTRKGQAGLRRDRALDRLRGSSHLAGRVDNAWLIDVDGDDRQRLSFVKSRHGKSPEDVLVRLQDLPGGGVVLGEVAATPSRGDVRRIEILDHLVHSPLKASSLANLMDVSVKTVNGYLRPMVVEGALVKTGEFYAPS